MVRCRHRVGMVWSWMEYSRYGMVWYGTRPFAVGTISIWYSVGTVFVCYCVGTARCRHSTVSVRYRHGTLSVCDGTVSNGMVRYGVGYHGTMCSGTLWCCVDTVSVSMPCRCRYGVRMVRYDKVRSGMVLYGIAWYDLVRIQDSVGMVQ